MPDENLSAPVPEPTDVVRITPPADAPVDMSPSDAARILRSARQAKASKPIEEPRAADPAAAPTPQSTAPAEDAAPEPPATGETTDDADPAQSEPSLERPRSWSKDRADAWAKLDRDTQQYLLDHDREASATVRKVQNETADKLKGLTAKEQAVEQARQHYEAALPQLLQTLQSSQAGEFSDVRTFVDVENLARNDWPRYLQWDLAQKKIAAVQQEMQAAHQRQDEDKRQKFAEFAKREDDLFIEKAPDMADAKKAEALQRSAMATLKGLGFEDSELVASWQGIKDLSLRDHRLQLLIRDATLWRDAQAKAKAVTSNAKPVPPVQRPGTARGRGDGLHEQVNNAFKRLERASGNDATKIGVELMRARRAATAR